MIPAIPDIFSRPVTLIHAKSALIVAILEYDTPVAMLVTILPVAFVQESLLNRNAVAESIPPIGRVAPLALVVVSSVGASQRAEGTLVEIQEGHWAVIVLRKILVHLPEPVRYESHAFLDAVEIYWEANLAFFGSELIAHAHRVAVIEELLEAVCSVLSILDLGLQLANKFEQLVDL